MSGSADRSPDVPRVSPPAVFAAAWMLQRLVARHRTPTAGSRAAASALLAGSGALAVTAAGALARSGTEFSPAHPDRSTELVTDGAFAVTRNPLYLAMTGVLLAHAVLRRSVIALAPAAGFVAVLDRTQVPAEEQALRSRFGKRYERYAEATPRWLRRCGRR